MKYIKSLFMFCLVSLAAGNANALFVYVVNSENHYATENFVLRLTPENSSQPKYYLNTQPTPENPTSQDFISIDDNKYEIHVSVKRDPNSKPLKFAHELKLVNSDTILIDMKRDIIRLYHK